MNTGDSYNGSDSQHRLSDQISANTLYTRVANTTIRAVTSPLDRLAPLIEGSPPEA